MRSNLHDVALVYQTETALAACFHEEDNAGPLLAEGRPQPRDPYASQGEASGSKRFALQSARDIWLPLAEIEIAGERRRGAIVTVTAPEWLLNEKGLV